MKNSIAFSCIFLLTQQVVFSQNQKLLPLQHGLDLIHGNASKEKIIMEVKFTKGENKNVDILRFDNVGEIHGDNRPLIISSDEPVRVDSLGLLSAQLYKDSLKSLLKMIVNYDKEATRKHHHEDTLFRITYRYNGSIGQFFVPGARNATSFFKVVEHKLNKVGDNEIVNKLDAFLGFSGLIRKPRGGGSKWRW